MVPFVYKDPLDAPTSSITEYARETVHVVRMAISKK